MQRYRKIAAAPERSSSQSWQLIATVIRDSLGRSSHIDPAEVDACLARIEGFACQLVAAGHLDNEKHAMTLVAGDLHVCFNTVSGDRALALEENLNFVPGAARATNWTIYLPTPDPLGSIAEDLAAKDAHLSTAPPPPTAATKSAATLDQTALRKWAREAS